ncbi:MAG TPA: hypothetical protein VF017_04620 [Thermoanaerobaculia bacterium]|nr:hypothetical protein [Thermoanaerobaculia bacterium]
MSEALRTFTVRNPTLLNARQTARLGIESHPTRHQSDRFHRWAAYCNDRAMPALDSALQDFLRSDESVSAVADLEGPWPAFIEAFYSQAPAIPAREIVNGLGSHQPRTLCGENNRLLFRVRTRVADTLLALARLKQLGNPDHLDYQSLLRIVDLFERVAASADRQLPEAVVRRHFEKPILLPRCFFRLPSCDPVDGPRRFGVVGEAPRPVPRARGCKSDGDCGCTVNEACVEQRHCCAKVKAYVVDLMAVRTSTRCYVPGDLSFVKNVLAGETLATKHRRLEKTEEVAEIATESSRYAEKDLQIDDKSALHKEISDISRSDLALDAGVTSSASWGTGYKFTANTSFSLSLDKSKEQSNKEIRDYSRNVVDRAISKLDETFRTLARTTRLTETEETNDHQFANAAGPNVSGQYLYVDKLSRAQVYNYGKSGAVELLLPEPAALFLALIAGKFGQVPPTAPAALGFTAQDLTPDNYLALAQKYGVDDAPAPPPFRTTLEVVLEAEPGDPKGKNNKSGSHTYSFNCVIPTDYAGTAMSVNVVRLNYNEGGGVSISATLGPNGDSVWHQHGGSSSFSSALPGVEGNQTIIVHSWDVTNFTWVLTVTCNLKPAAKASWQAEVFAKIEQKYQQLVEKYEQQLAKYQEAKDAFLAREAALRLERFNRNPFINRETERTELQRMAISFVSCQFYDRFDAMKSRVKPCGYPEMDVEQADQDGRFVQFFEQAFNWSLMIYVFYGYFWGRKCTWAEKLAAESNDPIFQKFLAAGSARVLVPIRDGFFDLVQYFLATGEIWGGAGAPPLPDDPHYVSMAQEIREQNGNYYADREGRLEVTQGQSVVVLEGSDWYWIYDDPLATPPVVAGVDELKVTADLDREIIIDCKVYRIVAIEPNASAAQPTSWLITLDRAYAGKTAKQLSWSTGALYVGAPWEFVAPTTLTFLRAAAKCLPCYPLAECAEDGE